MVRMYTLMYYNPRCLIDDQKAVNMIIPTISVEYWFLIKFDVHFPSLRIAKFNLSIFYCLNNDKRIRHKLFNLVLSSPYTYKIQSIHVQYDMHYYYSMHVLPSDQFVEIVDIFFYKGRTID
jgi:hypothetical protein